MSSPPTPEISFFANRFHHRDHLGSLRLITTDSGGVLEALDFYPFGMEMAGAGAHSSRKYTGHERDERTGLDYMMARYKGVVDPGFLSPDPLGDSSPGVPGSLNRMSYVQSQPVSASDPSGLSRFSPFDRSPWADDVWNRSDSGEGGGGGSGCWYTCYFIGVEPYVICVIHCPGDEVRVTPKPEMDDLYSWWSPDPDGRYNHYDHVEFRGGGGGRAGRRSAEGERKSVKRRLCEFTLNVLKPRTGTAALGGSGLGAAGFGVQGSTQLALTAEGKIAALVTVGGGGAAGLSASMGVVGSWFGTSDLSRIGGLGVQGGGSVGEGVTGGAEWVASLPVHAPG